MSPRDSIYGAVEGGGTRFVCGVAHGPHDWIARHEIPTADPVTTLNAVADFFAPYRDDGLQRVGFACFGPLDLDRGRMHRTPKPGWSGVAVVDALTQRLTVPVALETDVNAAALAEARWGAAQDADPVVYITVGTGVGVGVVVRGQCLRGLMHPELGHLPAPALDDIEGTCPFHGRCIEGVASGVALRARLGMEPSRAPDGHAAWAREGEYLAHLVVAAILALSPQRVVVGGGVAQRSAIWPSLRATTLGLLAGYLPVSPLSEAGIDRYLVPAALSPHAGLMGALALAIDGAALAGC